MDPTASEVNGQEEQDQTPGQGAGEDQALQGGDSETQGQATQEPQTPTTYTPAQVEQMRREWQSAKDREIYETRMRLIREQDELRRQAAERERLANMDDEEYGSYVRQQQAEQERLQQYAQEQWRGNLIEIQKQTLDAIPNKAVRQQIEDKINAGGYQSWADMQRDIVSLTADRQSQAAAEKAVREALAAAQRDGVAQLADTPIPTLGSGQPARRSSTAGLSPEQLMGQGFAEELAKKKRGR